MRFPFGAGVPRLGGCDNTPVTSCLVPPPVPVMGITAGGGAA